MINPTNRVNFSQSVYKSQVNSQIAHKQIPDFVLQKDTVSFRGAQKINDLSLVNPVTNDLRSGIFDGNGKFYVTVHGTDPYAVPKKLGIPLLTNSDKLYVDTWVKQLQEQGKKLDKDFRVSYKRYKPIMEGQNLEICGKHISKTVNEQRLSETKKQLAKITTIIKDTEQLKKHFNLSVDDPNSDKLLKLIPGRVRAVKKIVRHANLNTFSTKLMGVERKLARDIEKDKTIVFNSDVDRKVLCDKLAGNIMKMIAPKAVLIGHSLGGFANYVVGLNPKKSAQDNNSMAFDAGNGLSTIISISSPVNKGLKGPLPDVFMNFSYDLYKENVLDHVEKTPMGQMFKGNPFYEGSKEYYKAVFGMVTNAATSPLLPLVHANHPAYKQVTEGSRFIEDNIKNKKIPDGVTMLSYFHEEDNLVLAECSEFDNTNTDPNKHCVEIDLKVDDKFIMSEKLIDPTLTEAHIAHRLLAVKPIKCREAFDKKIIDNPEWAERLLNIKNSDDVRNQCLSAIKNHMQNDEFYLKEKRSLYKTLLKVSDENSPFTNSPSAIAKEILSS